MRDDARDGGAEVELAVLAVRKTTAACRVLGSGERVTLRSAGIWNLFPGEIATIGLRKRWTYGGHAYLSGDVLGWKLDAAALGLVPLRLEPRGEWDPAEEYWGEEDEAVEAWARPIIARGPRPAFEMEQVIPGEDPGDLDTDPILEANDLKAAGDGPGAYRILMDLCQADLRCLDAHAHLGNLELEVRANAALRHFEAGVRIGELSLGPGFDGVLGWSWLDNRPFLRCLHGCGLALWRLDRFEEAEAVFRRMLWLNPSDNQGERFNLAAVQRRLPWSEER